MRIIIIGGSGLIGSSFYSLSLAQNLQVIGTYNTVPKTGMIPFNMCLDPLRTIVPDLNSRDVVYLLAAYSNPSWIFNNQEKSRDLNLISTKRIINEIIDAGARIIFMSSVEVFDGEEGDYSEESLPNPLNLYGKMKAEIEDYLNIKKAKSCIVRTGWNVGWTIHHRCVIELTYKTLMQPNAKMAHDNTFSISDVNDTAKGLLSLSYNNSMKKCHLASAPFIIRSDLASKIISLSKYKNLMGYKNVSFSDIPYSEPRARLNHLNNSHAINDLGMKFTPSDEIIRRKVELLDQNINNKKSNL